MVWTISSWFGAADDLSIFLSAFHFLTYWVYEFVPVSFRDRRQGAPKFPQRSCFCFVLCYLPCLLSNNEGIHFLTIPHCILSGSRDSSQLNLSTQQ